MSADRFSQERNPPPTTAPTAATVPTPGLVGPWSPVPATVEAALNQLILVPHPVLLGQLGPDIVGGGFGSANWINGAFVGTYTAGFGSALGSAVLCGGYVAQTDEVIEQITISSWTGPSAASTIHIHVQPAGGAFADTLQTITVGLGATETYYTTPLVLNRGDKVAFELDVADPVWSVFASGISLYGLRRAA